MSKENYPIKLVDGTVIHINCKKLAGVSQYFEAIYDTGIPDEPLKLSEPIEFWNIINMCIDEHDFHGINFTQVDSCDLVCSLIYYAFDDNFVTNIFYHMLNNNHMTSSKWSNIGSGYDIPLYNIITNGISDERDLHERNIYYAFDDIRDIYYDQLHGVGRSQKWYKSSPEYNMSISNIIDGISEERNIYGYNTIVYENDPEYILSNNPFSVYNHTKTYTNQYLEHQLLMNNKIEYVDNLRHITQELKQKNYQTDILSDKLQRFFNLLKNTKLTFDVLCDFKLHQMEL
jgi:hypothetical protein